jgi:hypothetical protein
VSERDTVIVVVHVASSRAILFQGLLQGEDGLAVMRSRDADRSLHELWTVPAQLPELYVWLRGLPAELGVRIMAEKRYP